MLDVGLLFKLGGVGLVVVVIEQILVGAKKQDMATIINFAAILMIVGIVAGLMSTLFNNIRGLFQL
ncbi:SpoIIIAC/SpoIIIAD family protein [Clostridium sp.]|uniref:SpoIIIAC/SpoIIIAD family protein n=1 Tax=Clostridium sp. TaxID=1506 RepID=UPI003FD77E75